MIERKLTDHEFAAYLRKHDAIDNWASQGVANIWRDSDGTLVAIAIYDNAASTHKIFTPKGTK